ncbi:hypothetical protein ABIC02_007557 [Bradyrhizobium sp. RT5a]
MPAPCGVPRSVSCFSPLAGTPARSHSSMSRKMRGSAILCATIRSSHSCRPSRKTTRKTTHHHAHHLDDYPDQVTIVRSRHPFEGSALNVLGWCHRRGELHLTLVLPDGTRALVPAAWTDLPIAQHFPRASPQCTRAAFLASHAELLHARTIVDALLRQLDAAHTVLPPESEDSHAAAKLSRPTTSARCRTRMGGPR